MNEQQCSLLNRYEGGGIMEETDSKLEIKKEFPVTKERLYQAWTSTEELKQWWKPFDWYLDEVRNDLKEGGDILFKFKTSGSPSSLVISGNYFEVIEKEKLVYSWNWKKPLDFLGEEKFKLTVSFQPAAANGSILLVTQEKLSEDESLTPNREGWKLSLNDLHLYLTNADTNKEESRGTP